MKNALKYLPIALALGCGGPLDAPPTQPSGTSVESELNANKTSAAARSFLHDAWGEAQNRLAITRCRSYRVSPSFQLTVFDRTPSADPLALLEWTTEDGVAIEQLVRVDALEPVIGRSGGEYQATLTVGGKRYALDALEVGAALHTPSESIRMVCALE
jgi:hypothetical protein